MISADIDTPLGNMVAIADENALHFLGFGKVEDVAAAVGRSSLIDWLEEELKNYFSGQLQQFTVPYVLSGTPFQIRVWQALCQIPFGASCSYLDLARSIGKPKAFRALANANGVNPLAIVVPCHRVIYHNGGLGGYASGLDKKRWLLVHEQEVVV